jgi:parvulin-like peptidyl-prolyl isomerase
MIFSRGGLRVIAAFVLLLAFLQAISCDRPAPREGEDGEVLARVGGEAVTVDEFKEALARSTEKHPRIYSGARKSERLLRHLVDEEALFAQALEEGYDKNPLVAGALRKLVVGEYLKKNLIPLLDGVKVIDEEVSKHYRENLARYRTHELVRAAVISFRVPPGTDETGRRALLDKAASVLEEARGLPGSVAGFGELAVRYSDDLKTRAGGGDIGWIVRTSKGSGLDPDLRAEIVQLQKPGALSAVIETDKAFYLAKMMELRPARQRPLSEVHSAVRAMLLNTARDAAQDKFYRELRARRKVSINLELLEKLEKPPAAD